MKLAKSLATDFIGLCGVGLISYGAWLAFPAAGFIVAGLFIVGGVVLNSRSPK